MTTTIKTMFRFLAAMAAMTTAVCLLAATQVCNQCGYEIVGDANFCWHCGAPVKSVATSTLPDSATATNTVSSAAAGSIPEAMPAENVGQAALEAARKAIDDDFAISRAFAESGHKLQMLAPLLNARAIGVVSGRNNAEPEKFAALELSIAEIRKTGATQFVMCPRCAGKKTIPVTQTLRTLQDKTTTVTTGTRQCPRCNGAGLIGRMMTPDEIGAIIAKGRKAFAEKNAIDGRVKLAEAWVPAALLTNMNVRQKARLAVLTALPCDRCHGYGRQSCKKCDGTGVVACTAKGCDGGIVRGDSSGLGLDTGSRPVEKRLESLSIRLDSECAVCKGSGEISCADCGGVGGGVCSGCKGSGLDKECRKCRGDGLEECRKCRGTGFDRKGKKCGECGGEKEILCKSCGGDGHG